MYRIKDMKKTGLQSKIRVKALLISLLLQLSATVSYCQQIGARTNALWWLTTTPNLGVEVAMNKKLTLSIDGNYNAWTFFSDGMSLRHWLMQPELRYWPCKSFEGHFFGVHGHYGRYNIGQVPFLPGLDTYTYRGKLYGAGVSYGYHFALGKRWGLELNAGLGYTYLEYDKYVCSECAELIGRYKRSFFGPTRLGVSFIYIIH
ncbi:DUF3575 domain-containing protein [uncultured Parabacteroides sp.]|jgi:hypothetical protein|uniref:DUF3575 domain-containing protein n=1 Tax=uncultured Parabacteroides sp. TaxID=512312 RepID=UPI0025FF2D2F|nr:DUF3575 domain-containing protein [uncultured Parabacteroides sp.]